MLKEAVQRWRMFSSTIGALGEAGKCLFINTLLHLAPVRPLDAFHILQSDVIPARKAASLHKCL